MRALILPRDMRRMEMEFFEKTGTKSIDLMERAAAELTEEILLRCGEGRTLIAACGTGGNGGDGLACARMYSRAGGRAYAVLSGEPATEDCRENLRRAMEAGVEILPRDEIWETPGIWVDGLFGTGLSRAPSGIAAELIQRMNADRKRGSRIFSVDIPSGIDGSTGRAYEACVEADVTVSFQFGKCGHRLQDGLEAAGELIVRDIGIPTEFFPKGMAREVEPSDIPAYFPPRKRNTHKGNYGHVLIVAGSVGMAGAAAMCAMGAMRAGAGLTTIACPKSIVPILQTLAPCAMCLPMPEQGGALSAESAEPLRRALEGKTAAVMGCGLSRRAAWEAVRAVVEADIPTVLDADALNILSEHPMPLRERHIVTPHPGEAKRLLGTLPESPIEAARALAGMGCTALYKGAGSAIASPRGDVYLSASGCAGMAKGGSGDALSGILGALLANNPEREYALTAALASEIHGRAGESAQEKYGSRGMLPTDLIEALSGVFPC